MHPIDFLNSDEADLPKTRVGNFALFLDNIIGAYRSRILQVSTGTFLGKAIRNELSRIEPLWDALHDVVELLTAGDRPAAYNRLDGALKGLDAHFRALMPTDDMSHVVNSLYRFRLVGKDPYNRGGLFHIPFNLRHIVSEMRYSVAGQPSLYLGGSTEVCWRELGCPDLDKVVVSRFHAVPGKKLRVLNFGRRLPLLAAWVAAEPDKFLKPTNDAAVIVSRVACWPLFAACSVRVPDKSKPERPEYMVPQLVLEWITKTHAFHGIRYFSTNYPEYPDDPNTYMTYVFPSCSDAVAGYCPTLRDLFELTEPMPWGAAKALPDSGIKRPKYKYHEVLRDDLEAEFGRVESGLLGLPTAPV